MWRRCDHDRREYRPHRHQGVGRGINPLRGQTFCPREDNTSLIVNRQSSIINRQSSIVNRQSSIINRLSPVVERLIPVLAAVGSIPWRGQTFCLRYLRDNVSLIIVNRQSSIVSGRATDPGASGRGINPLRREITLLKAWCDCVQ